MDTVQPAELLTPVDSLVLERLCLGSEDPRSSSLSIFFNAENINNTQSSSGAHSLTVSAPSSHPTPDNEDIRIDLEFQSAKNKVQPIFIEATPYAPPGGS